MFLLLLSRTPMQSDVSHKSYRPVTVLTFRLNHALSGLSAPAFHLTNVLIHALACLLLYGFAHVLFGDKRPAFVASVIFAVHSVHTEAVRSSVALVLVFAVLSFSPFLIFPCFLLSFCYPSSSFSFFLFSVSYLIWRCIVAETILLPRLPT